MNPTLVPESPPFRPARAIVVQLGAIAIGAIALIVASRLYPLDRLMVWMRTNVDRYEPWSALGYPFVHASCNLLLLPAGVLVVGSGFFFGVWKGFVLALTGHLLGAAGAFAISRTLGRGLIERHLASRPQWQALDRAIEREGWKIVCLSQLSPLFPTSLFNYCYGLTRLRFWPCMLWIAVGWSPGMFLYAYLGRLGQFGWKIWQEGARPTPGQYAGWIAGLAAAIGVTVAMAHLASRLLLEARARGAADATQSPR